MIRANFCSSTDTSIFVIFSIWAWAKLGPNKTQKITIKFMGINTFCGIVILQKVRLDNSVT